MTRRATAPSCCEAARTLVAERGADAVTMDDVAAAAGVGKGTLFRRFGSRAGLMMVLLDEDERASQQAFLFGPPPLGPDAPPLDRLVAFGRDRIRFVHTHHALLSAANRDPQTRYGPPAAVLRTHVRVLLASARHDRRPRCPDRCPAGPAGRGLRGASTERRRPHAGDVGRRVGKRGTQALREVISRMPGPTPSWVLHVDLDQFLASVELRAPSGTGRAACHRRRQR